MYHLPLANSWAWGVQALVAWILPLPRESSSKEFGVGSVIPHHHYCLLAALSQFSIHILHCKAWQQGSILCIQSLLHYIKMFSQTCLSCPLQVLHGRKKVPMFLLFGYTLRDYHSQYHTPPPGSFPTFHWCHSLNC